MNLDYYDLKQNPFLTTPDLDNLFVCSSYNTALMAIIDGVKKRSGIVVITGPEEVGKTTILRAFLHQSDPTVLKTIRIEPALVLYPDIVAVVAQALGLDAQTDDVEALLAQVHAALREEYHAGRNVALVIDDAQRMSPDTLASLSKLVTLEASGVHLLQIVMAGSRAFQKTLNEKSLRFLKRYIAVHATLSPLTKKESIAYIRDSLAKATEKPTTIFSRRALKRIVTYARGMPRNLNILCADALVMGSYRYEQPISSKTIKDVIADLESVSRASSLSRRLVGAIGAVATVVVVGLLWFSLPKVFLTVNADAFNSLPSDRPTLVAQSESVAPSKPSLPISGDERHVTKAEPQTPLSQPRMEAIDGEDKSAKVVKDQKNERSPASKRDAAKRETTTVVVARNQQTPSPLPQEVARAAEPAAMQAKRPPQGVNDNAWLYTQHPQHYSVQLLSTESEADAQRYLAHKQLGSQATYFHARIEGKDWYYVLYGSFATREEAQAAGQRITTSAWIRRFGVLQKKRCIGATDLPSHLALEVTLLCAQLG